MVNKVVVRRRRQKSDGRIRRMSMSARGCGCAGRFSDESGKARRGDCLTFQQVQKYERGANPSAPAGSRPEQGARRPGSFFFEEMAPAEQRSPGLADRGSLRRRIRC